jgi:predicted 3-demethylubiquinone-9 3-methyltransferase (glyoxalase superfamily)
LGKVARSLKVCQGIGSCNWLTVERFPSTLFYQLVIHARALDFWFMPTNCGWLKERFGVSWQAFPGRLTQLTLAADRTVSAKAIAAMIKQKKI